MPIKITAFPVLAAILVFTMATAKQTKPPPQYRINYVKKQLAGKGMSLVEIDLLLNDERLLVKRGPIVKSPEECGPTTWKELQEKMMSDESVLRGKQYIRSSSGSLERAQKKHGVAREDIAAILRIETDFGKCLGDFSAFNVLYRNLARKHWLRQANNLVALALYCKEIQMEDCHEVPGSSAGAIGLPQFMPASLRFAEDGDGDGIADLFNEDDANMSAANFLKRHGYGKSLGSKKKALASYYGTDGSYVDLTLEYAAKLRRR